MKLLGRSEDNGFKVGASGSPVEPGAGRSLLIPLNTRHKPSSRGAAHVVCEGREGHGEAVRDRDAKAGGKPLLSWAFTTISHHLLPSALPRRRSGTDRGRQSASPRITGGLVSHHGYDASLAAHVGSRTLPRRSGARLELAGRVQPATDQSRVG
jgi:hypothetical protein